MFLPETRGAACSVCTVNGSARQSEGEIPGLPASVEVCRCGGDEKPKMTLEAGRQEKGSAWRHSSTSVGRH